MKCPLCKAPTEVKHTKDEDGTPIRRRHCYNDHSFNTKEVAITTPKPKRELRKKLAIHESGPEVARKSTPSGNEA
jgi:transcriptional regulator NrdR family protein